MADLHDIATRVAQDSDILRIYPNKLVQVFVTGTQTLVAEVTADMYGRWAVPTLATGTYDIRVDGQTVRTIHHVKADHTHKTDESWVFFYSGSITADTAESSGQRIFITPVAGKIISVRTIAQRVTNVGDVTAHILKGTASGASALALGASIWSHRIYVGGGATVYRVPYVDSNPSLQLAANDVITTGLDYVATGIEGVTIQLIFRPD